MDRWVLPRSAAIGGRQYKICADYREVLELFELFQDETLPKRLQVRAALELFYEEFETMPPAHHGEAVDWMFRFFCGGEEELSTRPAVKRIDWSQDQPLIVADINKVAGCEIRAQPFLHWWTFFSFFQAIGEGRLSTVLSIREKKRRGQKLEKWEREFYRENRSLVDFRRRYTPEEEAERARLQKLLGD